MNKMIPSLAMALSLSLINPTLVTLASATVLTSATAAEATKAAPADLAQAPDKVAGDHDAPLDAQVQPASGDPANMSAPTPTSTRTSTLTSTPSPALPGEPTGAALAHTCAACHGTNGLLGDEYFMPLAGMPVTQFVTTMREFRSGERLATLMGHVASGFSDPEIQAMGEFFAAIASPPALAATAPGAKP